MLGVRGHMRNWVVIVGVLVIALLSFGTGYWIADARGRTLVAENQLAALQHYVPAIVFLGKGDINSAKGILYIGVDGSLSTFSHDAAASLSTTSRPILSRLLPHLNAAWNEDRPYEDDKSASLRKLPEWVQMREQNDAFRRTFASDK
jgi:hypothetical protein